MEKKLMILPAAVFAGVLIAGVVVAKPGVLDNLNPTSAVAESARSLLGGEQEDEDDDDDYDYDEYEDGEDHEDGEHDDEDDDEDDD